MSIKTEATPLEKVKSFYVSSENSVKEKEIRTIKGIYENTLLTHAEIRMLLDSKLLSKYVEYDKRYYFSLPSVYVGYALTLFNDDVLVENRVDIMKLDIELDMETGRYYKVKPFEKVEEEKSFFQRIVEFIKGLFNA